MTIFKNLISCQVKCQLRAGTAALTECVGEMALPVCRPGSLCASSCGLGALSSKPDVNLVINALDMAYEQRAASLGSGGAQFGSRQFRQWIARFAA